MTKDEARRRAKRSREALYAGEPDAPMAVAEHVRRAATDLGIAPPSKTIAIYHAIETEMPTEPLAKTLSDMGHTLCLPCVAAAAAPLVFRVWRPGDPMIIGAFDIAVPDQSQAEVDPDLVFVPLLAFDDDGYRLGYGGGFYDRTLARLRSVGDIVAIGLAYNAQRMDRLPRDAYDQPLDFIATEMGVVRMPTDRTELDV